MRLSTSAIFPPVATVFSSNCTSLLLTCVSLELRSAIWASTALRALRSSFADAIAYSGPS